MPSFTTLMVASTAPQLLWPSTMISGTPSTIAPYSRLARPSSLTKFARHAHHEQLARALIEGELGRKAGIRAAHDAGERILRLRAGDASARVVPAGRRIGGVAGVALPQSARAPHPG
jgi:hypothetical protein